MRFPNKLVVDLVMINKGMLQTFSEIFKSRRTLPHPTQIKSKP